MSELGAGWSSPRQGCNRSVETMALERVVGTSREYTFVMRWQQLMDWDGGSTMGQELWDEAHQVTGCGIMIVSGNEWP